MADEAGRSRRSTTRITKSTVEEIERPPEGKRAVLWDAEVKGFGVRVTSAGVRTYVLRYQVGGGRDAPQRQVTIGRHGVSLTAEQARRRALDLLAQVRNGADPAGAREEERRARADGEERRAGRMFEVQADRWFSKHVGGSGLRSTKDIEGVLERDLKPALRGLTVEEVTKAKVAEVLEEIGERSPAAANKSHKWLRAMYNWFVEKGVVEHSPLEKMKRPFPEGRRTRVLSLLEVAVAWVAADALPPPFRNFYRLLILLGQRLREVSNVPWSEIDLASAEWLLPSARTKNELDHVVPLPDQALAVLHAIRGDRDKPQGPVLTTDGAVGISGFTKMKEALDAEIGRVLAASPDLTAALGAKLPHWVVHDLRRTLATGCQALRFPQEVTEAVLNHISGREKGVRGIYQLYDYFDEKAEALERWAKLIEQAVDALRRGDVQAVIELDPVLSARRRRRARRGSAGIQQDT